MSIFNEFTPVAAFGTVGDSVWVPSVQIGFLHESEGAVTVIVNYVGVPTHTTAAGDLQITGMPIPDGALILGRGTMSFSGITKAGYTQIVPGIATTATTINFIASGSGVAVATVMAADVPTGGTVNLKFELTFFM